MNKEKENKIIATTAVVVLAVIGSIATIDSEIKHRLWKRSLNEIGKLMEKVSTLKRENKELIANLKEAEIANLKEAEIANLKKAENKEKDSDSAE